MQNSRRIIWAIAAVAVIGTGLFFLNGWMKSQEVKAPTRVLPSLGTIPAFSLTTQDNTPYSNTDLKGKIWVADLIFTNCAGTCPMLSARMASLQTAIKKTGSNVHLVSVSVDPNNDTPDVLKQYGKTFQADFTRWTFLTGKVSTIYTLAKEGFHLTLDSAHEDVQEPITHSERLVLIDGNANIRGYYNGTEVDAESKLLADLGELLREEKVQ
ncbi:MAG TPA: SCO family protein [Candidatus Kapabacteria bacterium]|nr:SCO family protein [Candidatus Kapabacteria bacterium]